MLLYARDCKITKKNTNTQSCRYVMFTTVVWCEPCLKRVVINQHSDLDCVLFSILVCVSYVMERKGILTPVVFLFVAIKLYVFCMYLSFCRCLSCVKSY